MLDGLFERLLDFLEQLARKNNKTDILPAYWVAYVASAPPGPELDQRRLYLGQAYRDAGQIEDAIFTIEPVVRQGNKQALELMNELRGGPAAVAGPLPRDRRAQRAVPHAQLPARAPAAQAQDGEGRPRRP